MRQKRNIGHKKNFEDSLGTGRDNDGLLKIFISQNIGMDLIFFQ